jgi:hypothetical protein
MAFLAFGAFAPGLLEEVPTSFIQATLAANGWSSACCALVGESFLVVFQKVR